MAPSTGDRLLRLCDSPFDCASNCIFDAMLSILYDSSRFHLLEALPQPALDCRRIPDHTCRMDELSRRGTMQGGSGQN